MFLDNQLDVKFKLDQTRDLTTVHGVTGVTQVFPNYKNPELTSMYVVYVDPAVLEDVMKELTTFPEVEYVERIPLRTLVGGR